MNDAYITLCTTLFLPLHVHTFYSYTSSVLLCALVTATKYATCFTLGTGANLRHNEKSKAIPVTGRGGL
jgi:hypothetical protein